MPRGFPSLLDWFAGQALPGLLSTGLRGAAAAKEAYEQAEAMLEERDRIRQWEEDYFETTGSVPPAWERDFRNRRASGEEVAG